MKNKIGLEAEYLLRNKDNQLVYPADHGFTTDDFCILGEFRGTPGETREEAIANFIKEYFKVVYSAKKKDLVVDITKGWDLITPKFHSEILKKMGVKNVAKCQNIYNTDILTLTDAEMKDGKIVNQKISCGFHIHFSSEEYNETKFSQDTYEAVNLPLNIKIAGAAASFNLFSKKDKIERTVSATASRITKPVIDYFVKQLDETVLKESSKELPSLKYRNPGFYELKGWGFEYRSLPFNQNVFNNIHDIVDYSFKLLENL